MTYAIKREECNDGLMLNPKFKIFDTYEEAEKAFETLKSQSISRSGNGVIYNVNTSEKNKIIYYRHLKNDSPISDFDNFGRISRSIVSNQVILELVELNTNRFYLETQDVDKMID